MKLALECPTELLEDIQPLADYDFMLTHLVLKDEKYAEYYSKSRKFKVLDNSTNELLKPCSLDEIARATYLVRPDLVVAPDFLSDRVATESILYDAVRMFGKDRVLPVVQGEDYKEVILCADFIIRNGFDKVAVPYDITSSREDSLITMASGRHKVVTHIINRVPLT